MHLQQVKWKLLSTCVSVSRISLSNRMTKGTHGVPIKNKSEHVPAPPTLVRNTCAELLKSSADIVPS